SELLDFYQSHYSANLMTLCLVAPLSLDELQDLACHYFSGIRNLNLMKNYPQVPLFSEKELLRQIDIVPLKEQKRLSISFNFPGIDHYYKRKPLTYISHILGNESHGSLLSYLKEQGLVNNLSAGGGVNGYNFKDYSIGLQLTDKGLGNLDEIISCCFEYIELIKTQGLDEWRYLERANLLKMAFRYQEQVKSLDLASHLSINMHHYEVEDLVFGDYRMDGLDIPETIELLELMVPQNMRLQLIAQSVKTDRKANWYHTPYKVRPIAPQSLARWQVNNIRPELQLPAANPFIVADSIARPDKSDVDVPVIVAESTGYRIWHKKDDEFNVPKGHMYLSLDSEQASKTPRHAALTRLYVEMLL
ncbi:MAG: insulinase family protein, partial [Shewanella oncorhynchi]